MCRCNSECAAATLAMTLHHGLCQCNKAIRTVPMQHGQLCRCNSGCAAATRAVPLQLWLRHCNTGCAAATRVCHCSTGNSTTARAVPLQHELNQMICFECCRKRFKATTRAVRAGSRAARHHSTAQSAALFCFSASGTSAARRCASGASSTTPSRPALLLSAGA